MSNNINDDKYKVFKKKRLMKYLFIALAIITIVLEVLALLGKISMFWGIGSFIGAYLVKGKVLK